MGNNNGGMYVNRAGLTGFQGSLEDAATALKRSFDDLENIVNSLTSKETFTGDEATIFVDVYNNKVHPALDSIRSTIDKTSQDMGEEVKRYDALNKQLDDIINS